MIYELIIKELLRHKLRTALTIMGVSIGILLIVSLGSFSEGIKIFVDRQISYSSGLVSVIKKDISFQTIFYSEVDEDLILEFEGIPGVEEATGYLMGVIPDIGYLGGFDPEKIDMFSQMTIGLDEGRWPEKGADEVVAGSRAKDRLGLVLGDTLKIDKKEYDIVGIMLETGSEEDDDSVATSIETAQDILDKEGKVTMVILKPVDISEARDVANQINEEYGDSDDVQAGTDEDVRKFAEEMTGQLSLMTFGMGSIASIISGIVIMNVMFMAVRERRREIGVMKAIGATNRQILVEVIAESIGISLIGAFIGLVLSFGAVDFVNKFLGTSFAVITPGLTITAILFATIIGALAGAAPARQAAKLQPVEAIRYE